MSANAVRMSTLLRRSLLVDGLFSAMAGLPLAAASAMLADLFALPQPLLFWVGLFCVAYALTLLGLARSARLPTPVVAVISYGNMLWVLGSVLLAFGPWLAPNGLGQLFLVAQAVPVAGFAATQWLALRGADRLRPASSAVNGGSRHGL